MGFFDIVTDIIPGPLDDLVVSGVRGLFPGEGNGNGNGVDDRARTHPAPGMAPQPPRPAPRMPGGGAGVRTRDIVRREKAEQSMARGGGFRAIEDCIEDAFVGVPRQRLVNEPARSTHVIVRCGGRVLSMDRDMARRLKLFTPRAKPPVSAREWKVLREASRVASKVSKVSARAQEFTGGPKRRRRSR